MKMRILLLITIIALLGIAAAPAVAGNCCDEEAWDWAWVDYTEVDFRAMGFLWDNWLIPDGGTVAILPMTDYSDMSIVPKTYGGNNAVAGRRLAESLAFEFTRLGMLPIPYDDCEGAVMRVLQDTGARRASESQQNNQLHVAYKSDIMYEALKEFAPEVLRRGDMPGGEFLSREQIMMIGEMTGADVVVRGAIREYGAQSKIEANLRTFIPPFLGLFMKEKEAMIGVSLYMYDAHNGDLIWAAFESVEKASDFPLFTNDFELICGAESDIARRLVSHLVFPPPPDDWETCGGECVECIK